MMVPGVVSIDIMRCIGQMLILFVCDVRNLVQYVITDTAWCGAIVKDWSKRTHWEDWKQMMAYIL